MSNIPLQIVEPLVTIHPWSMESIGSDLTVSGGSLYNTSAAAWPVANASLLVPFTLSKRVTFVNAFWYQASAVGNIDAGVYDISGNLLGHTGSIVAAGTLQSAALSASFGPGVFYLALTASSLSEQLWCGAGYSATTLQSWGCVYIAANNMPMTTGQTIIRVATLFTAIPVFGISTRSVI
jgi:hypothetical protein